MSTIVQYLVDFIIDVLADPALLYIDVHPRLYTILTVDTSF